MKFSLALTSILILGSNLIAQTEISPLLTDRPDRTDSPFTVPVKSLQIETGFVFSKDNSNENSINTETQSFEIANTLLRYGITKSIELRLAGAFQMETIKTVENKNNTDGIGGVLLGTKIHLLQEKGFVPEAAVIVDFRLPVGNESFASKRVKPGFLFALTHTLSDFFGFSYNLGGVFDEADQFDFIYTASLSMSISEKIGSFIEIYGDAPSYSNTKFLFDTGFTYSLLNNLQFDSSLGLAITEESPDWFFNLGLSVRIPH